MITLAYTHDDHLCMCGTLAVYRIDKLPRCTDCALKTAARRRKTTLVRIGR